MKRIFYCPQCGKEEKRADKRQWCNCNNPPYQMYFGSKKQYKDWEKDVNSLFNMVSK